LKKNSPLAFENNNENAIHIPSYKGEDLEDIELEKLAEFLSFLKNVGMSKEFYSSL